MDVVLASVNTKFETLPAKYILFFQNYKPKIAQNHCTGTRMGTDTHTAQKSPYSTGTAHALKVTVRLFTSQSKIGVMYISGKKENFLSKTQKVGLRTGRSKAFGQLKIMLINNFQYAGAATLQCTQLGKLKYCVHFNMLI